MVDSIAVHLLERGFLSVLASLAAGFAAYLISQSNKSVCTWILAACLLATGIPVQISAWNDLPVWYNLLFLVLLVPVTVLGARLAAGRQSTQSTDRDTVA